MKIMHLLTSTTFSGAENVACQIIKLFDDPSIEMTYCSPSGPVKDSVKKMGIQFLPLSNFSYSNVKKAIKQYNPDIIHAHDMRASFMATLTCGRIPIISHIHNNNFDSRGLSMKSVAYLIAAIRSRHIVWVSRSAYDGYYFSHFLKRKSTILYNVINIEKLIEKSKLAKDKGQFDVIFLGRLTAPKNPLRLIDIFDKVVKINPSVKIGIIGDGDMREVTQGKISQLGLNKNITLTGYCDNPMGFVKNAKVMVMSSLFEGTPMCALESLGLGTPIVSTPVDGLKDIIINDHNGYLSDSNDELARYICKIISNDNFYNRLSTNAIQDSNNLNDLSLYHNKLFKIYSEVTNS